MANGTTLALASGLNVLRNIALNTSGTVDVASGSATLAGVISGVGAVLVKTGAGTYRMTGTNTYSGGTTLSLGTIDLASNAGLGTGALSMGSGTTLTVASGISAANNITLNTSGTINVASSTTATLTGVISGVGATLVKTGSNGTLVLSGDNTYSGGTTISTGTLSLTHANALGTGTLTSADDNASIVLANGLNVANTIVANQDMNALVASGNTATLSGDISGETLTKADAGTLILSGNNSMALAFVLSGEVIATTNTALGASCFVTGIGTPILTLQDGLSITTPVFISTGALNVNSGSATLTGTISGSTVSKTGAGTIVLSGSNSFSGTTTLSGGTISLGNNGGLGTSALSMASGTTLALGSGITASNGVTLTTSGSVDVSSGTGTLSGVIGGTSATLVKTGGATLSLTGTNTYTGGTTLSVGTLSLGNSSGLGSGALTMASGTTLALGSGIAPSNTVSLTTSGTVSVASGTGTLSGVISGVGAALVKAGAATLSLTGTNTHSGGTTLSAGTISLGADGGLGSGALTMASGTTLALGSGIAPSNNVSLTTSGTVNVASGTGTLSGVISGVGAALVKTGAATLALTGTNTHSGGTTVSAGTVQVGGDAPLGDSAAILTLNGGTLSTTASFAAGRGITLGASNGTISVATDTTLTSSGTIGGGGSLTKTGSGTLAVTGTSSYTGSTQVSAGTLSVSGSMTTTSGITIAGDALLTTTAFNKVVTPLTVDTNGIFELNLNSGSATAILSDFMASQPGIFQKRGSDTLNLNAANTYTGGTNLLAGPLGVGNNSALGTGTLTMAGSTTLNFNDNHTVSNSVAIDSGSVVMATLTSSGGTLGGVISGDGQITVQGSGSLTLSGTNTFNGNVVIDSGSATLSGQFASGTFQIGGDGLTVTGAGTHEVASIASSGPITIDAGASLIAGGDDSSTSYTGVMGGNGSFQKTGTGTLTLSASHALAGTFTIEEGAVALTGEMDEATLSMGGGTLAVTGASTHTLGNLTGSSNGTIGAGATLAVGNRGDNSTYAGVLSGSGVFSKVGAGILVLTGAHTYTGGTTVSGGTLQGNTTSLQGAITNNATLLYNQTSDGTIDDTIGGTGAFRKQGSAVLSLSSDITQTSFAVEEGSCRLVSNGVTASTITLDAGTTLQGNGTLTGDVTCSGTITPGDSIGVITIVGDYTQASGSTLEIEISPTDHDLVTITGAMSIESGTTIEIVPEFGTYPDTFTYTIVRATGGITGAFTTVTNSLPSMRFIVAYVPAGAATQINLVLGLEDITSLAESGNNEEAAACISSTFIRNQSDATFLVDLLRFMTEEESNEAFSQIHPGLFTTLFLQKTETAGRLRRAMAEHHTQESFRGSRWWMDTTYGKGTLLTESNQKIGFSNQNQTLVVGYDALKGAYGRLGGALGGSVDRLQWAFNRGTEHSVTLSLGLYGVYASETLVMQGSITGMGFHEVSERTIVFKSLQGIETRVAKGRLNGWAGDVFGQIGRQWEFPWFGVKPYIQGHYTYICRPGFHEEGAQALNLQVRSSEGDRLQGTVGVESFLYFMKTKRSLIMPYIQIAESFDTHFQEERQRASFDGSGCVMDVEGYYPDWVHFQIGGGLEMRFIDRYRLSLRYLKDLSRREKVQEASVRFDWMF
jgi:autotransporter-associated beta strand protein